MRPREIAATYQLKSSLWPVNHGLGLWKIMLVLEYEGTRYAGFQVQPSAATVQGAIEDAFFRLTGERTRLAAASRTDSGVHAKGQIATFLTGSGLEPERFVSGLNHFLPDDIGVIEARRADAAFDPRRNAWSRIYRYTILNRDAPSPLSRAFAYHMTGNVNIEEMRAAAKTLVGTQDVLSFVGDPGPRRTTVRRIDRADVWNDREQICVEMEANGFLPQQVRRTVGALVRVGRGQRSVEEFAQMVQCPVREAATWALPPQGLCLMRVTYKDIETG